MYIRKNFIDLTKSERDAFLAALLELKTLPAPESDSTKPADEQFSYYDQFIAIHTVATRVESVHNNWHSQNLGHGHPGFLPWHREFLLRLQRALHIVDSNVTLPYWDWVNGDATLGMIFQDDALGSLPSNQGLIPWEVSSGVFTSSRPQGADKPDWYPQSLNGWKLHKKLRLNYPAYLQGEALFRFVSGGSNLPTQLQIDAMMQINAYQQFWLALENGFSISPLEPVPTHNRLHGWVGGHMAAPRVSPFDPIFPMNHANVDRLWWKWQADNHTGPGFYPATDDWDGLGNAGEIPRGHLLDDEMFPWVGNNISNYKFANRQLASELLPDTTGEVPALISSVISTDNLINHTDLNYTYRQPAIRFSQVKKILDDAIDAWEKKHGGQQRLGQKHMNEKFGWNTRDQLISSIARNIYPLIDPSYIGNGRAKETILIQVLVSGFDGNPRMPFNGPYISSKSISTIAQWIDDGCLDDMETPTNSL